MRWIFAAIALTGCYAPHPQPGAPCASGSCPAGLVCSPATMTCELRAVDAAVDTSMHDARIDAAPDAPQIDAAVGPSLVQQNTNYADTATTLSVTLANLPAAGDVLVMIGGTPYSQLDSVTGGGVATWTQAAASLTNANIEVWVGVTNGSSATVTIACAANTTSMDISVTEWAGLVTTNLVDAGAATSGTTSPADAGPITTTHAHDLLLFGAADGAPNTWGSPGAGWTALTPMTGSITQAQWYRYVTSTGTYEPTASETANAWDAAVVALRAP